MKKNKPEFQRPVGHHQAHQHMHMAWQKRRGEGKKDRKDISQNFSDLMKNINLHMQETQQIPTSINAPSSKDSPLDSIIKHSKDKDKKSWKHWDRVSVRLTANFSTETMKSKRQWNDILNVLKGKKNSQARILCPAKLSFKSEVEINGHTVCMCVYMCMYKVRTAQRREWEMELYRSKFVLQNWN